VDVSEGFADAVAHESSADDALPMAATQKPIAIKCVQEQMTKPEWKEKPSWFLVAERDRMILLRLSDSWLIAQEATFLRSKWTTLHLPLRRIKSS
jgi:hypothetical protein